MQIAAEQHTKPATSPVNNGIRAGEKEKFWYRSDRLIKIDDQWYFTTRESRDVGPYSTREYAENGLAIFIESVYLQKTSVNEAILTASQGDWAVNFYH